MILGRATLSARVAVPVEEMASASAARARLRSVMR